MVGRVDVVVVGLGVMGGAVTATLADRGMRVLGVDRAWPAHDGAASSGGSRILRRAYRSHPEYGRLTGPALAGWLALQEQVSTQLFLPTGGLLVGRSDSAALRGAVAVAAADDVPYHVMDTGELRRRYGGLRFATDAVAFVDEEAGVLLAEPCVRAFHQLAVASGAELRFGTTVDLADLLRLWTDDHIVDCGGSTVRADAVVLAIGADVTGVGWPPVTTERTVSYWLAPGDHAAALAPDRLPFVEWQVAQGEFCLMPALADGIKVKFHHTGQTVPPGAAPADTDSAEFDEARTMLAELTGLRLAPLRSKPALYTNTADGRFVVGGHPAAPGVVVVSACSGHGFKFAPVIATEVVAVMSC
jgi:sarcosine oxidase